MECFLASSGSGDRQGGRDIGCVLSMFCLAGVTVAGCNVVCFGPPSPC